jgi:hypothetical protein
MKIVLRAIAVLAILIMLVLAGIQGVLQAKLTGIVQQQLALSRTAPFEQTTVEHVRFNLFTGKLEARLVAVPNTDSLVSHPHMLAAPLITARIAWPDLLRGIINIRHLEVPQLTLTIIRDADGAWNLPWLPQTKPAPIETPAEVQAERETTLPTPPKDQPPPRDITLPSDDEHLELVLSPLRTKRLLHIANANLKVTIIYIDKHTDPDEFPLIWQGSVTASGIFTYGYLPEAFWGSIRIDGSAADAPQNLSTEIEIRLAPLLEPEEASFTMEGHVLSIPLSRIAPWQEATGIDAEALDIRASLSSEQGILQSGAHLSLKAQNANVTSQANRRLRNLSLPAITKIHIPVSGTLQNPTINLAQAITQSLLETMKENPDALFDQIRIDGKSLRERIRTREN